MSLFCYQHYDMKSETQRTNSHLLVESVSSCNTVALSEWVEFNAPPDTQQVISEAVFTANHLTDTDKQSSTGK